MRDDHGRIGDRVLLIDDDVELSKLIVRFLGREGLEVDAVASGRAGIERALSGGHALIVLDIMLPDVSGLDVLRRIRETSRTPVLMLTAKGEARDRILGLETGADDYLSKPFNPGELAARIRAILRRATPRANQEAARPTPPLVVGDLELDPGARVVRRRADVLNLTTVEFDVLEILLRSAGRVVSREALTREALGRPFSPFDRAIDTHVYSLRKKTGRLEDGSERIKGIRGIGYLYAVPAKSGEGEA
jgi:two-component system response regulator CpxR